MRLDGIGSEKVSDEQSPNIPTSKPANVSPGAGPNTSLLPDLPKETWEYLELKLWNSFSKKIWALVTAILSVLGLLTAIGMNAWIQRKVDAALETKRERFGAARDDFNRRSEASLLLAAIAFHIRTRHNDDLHRYIVKIRKLQETLPSESLNALLASEKLRPLVWPIQDFDHGSFAALSDKEVKEAVHALRSALPQNDLGKLQDECQKLALASRHMLGLKKMAEAAERLVFSHIEADPQQLAKLYEEEVMPAYVKELRSKEGASFRWGIGEVAINSPSLSGESEFNFYVPNALDKLLSEKADQESEAK